MLSVSWCLEKHQQYRPAHAARSDVSWLTGGAPVFVKAVREYAAKHQLDWDVQLVN